MGERHSTALGPGELAGMGMNMILYVEKSRWLLRSLQLRDLLRSSSFNSNYVPFQPWIMATDQGDSILYGFPGQYLAHRVMVLQVDVRWK